MWAICRCKYIVARTILEYPFKITKMQLLTIWKKEVSWTVKILLQVSVWWWHGTSSSVVGWDFCSRVRYFKNPQNDRIYEFKNSSRLNSEHNLQLRNHHLLLHWRMYFIGDCINILKLFVNISWLILQEISLLETEVYSSRRPNIFYCARREYNSIVWQDLMWMHSSCSDSENICCIHMRSIETHVIVNVYVSNYSFYLIYIFI